MEQTERKRDIGKGSDKNESEKENKQKHKKRAGEIRVKALGSSVRGASIRITAVHFAARYPKTQEEGKQITVTAAAAGAK